MKKEYYIQGDPARAEEIKAAFEAKGINTASRNCSTDEYLYYTCNGLLYLEKFYDALLNVFKSNPHYKELELPVKPMFKVGDWLYHNKKGVYPILITDYDENLGYQTECLSAKTYLRQEFVEKEYHLWSITDAKPGDVLANDHHILILKELDYDWYTNGTPYSVHAYCGIKPNGNFELGKEHWCFCGTLHMRPATSEERDLLFAKMREAGYTWDEKKKELKKINEKDMTDEKSKELTCPKCGAVLDDKTYFEHTVYHNCIVGVCKKCGYNAPIHIFFKNQ